MNRIRPLAVALAMAAVAQPSATGQTATSETENQRLVPVAAEDEVAEIKRVTTTYLAKEAPGLGWSLSVEKTDADFARVLATPTPAETDPAYVFLKREGNGWAALVHGTGFSPADYDELGIPGTVRVQD